ncbi:Potassium voltage-gated channel protein Shaw [Mizuhopecten yessoensis]|uniref:Potassium voltage-gated channel protein Shaw n=1 Tax=Mizuhopecten yessoensis TaxID=6573 RepID=A0A210R6V9_MIZYE|nr:Potassium voltage-gated channel protein Shaw [Mizuhopecten yessoensis]
MDLVTLNLRGTTFLFDTTCIGDKVSDDSPLLHLDETSEYFLPMRDEFYFNKNADVFDCVLEYLSSGSVHIPRNVCTVVVTADLEFWGVPEGKVDLCCWKTFYQTDEDVAGIKTLLKHMPCDITQTDTSHGSLTGLDVNSNACSTLKVTISNLYNRAYISGKVWYGIQRMAILLSIAYCVVVSIPVFRIHVKDPAPYPYAITSTKMRTFWFSRGHTALVIMDAVCNLSLMLDWMFRFSLAENKKTFMKSFLNIVELCAWVTSWLMVYTELDRSAIQIPVTGDDAIGQFVTLCWFMVGGGVLSVRVLRIFRLIVGNCGVKILLLSLKSSARELMLLATSFSCMVIVFALMLYMAEITTSSSHSCPNALVGIWWAIVTMTTVGYGDYFPTTPQGFVVGIMCAASGILLLALPVAVTSSNFNDIYNFNKYRERHIKRKSASINSKEESISSC